MKYRVRSPEFIWTPCVQLYSMAEAWQPTHPHMGSYTRALLVSQDRRHLFKTPAESGCSVIRRVENTDPGVFEVAVWCSEMLERDLKDGTDVKWQRRTLTGKGI